VSPVVGHGIVLVIADETVGGEVTLGIVGTGPPVNTGGDALIVGTAAAELTPRLPISVDPSGIPARAAPPGVVGEVGVDDEAMLPEPEPHIPDKPDVSIIPEVVDIPEVADIPDEVDVADDDTAMVPVVAGVALPVVIPPPSKVAVDPNIPEGAVPTVEHAVPLLGMAVVPVEKAGAGLIPGDASSVEPSGIPVGETVEPVPVPSGEVAPMLGVGVAIPLTCATAMLLANSTGITAAINANRIAVPGLPARSPRREPVLRSFATIRLGARLSDICHSPQFRVTRRNAVLLRTASPPAPLRRGPWLSFALSRTRALRFAGCVHATR
jgi:hypothetical protein